MTAPRPFRIQPRLMGEEDAATFLGISRTTLRALGLPRRILGGRKLYDVIDLDAYASSLPTEGDGTCEADRAWGSD